MRFHCARIYRYSLPLVTPVNWGGVEHTTREGALLYLEDEEGLGAWGEAAPLPGFSRETLDTAIADLLCIVSAGDEPVEYDSLSPSAIFAHASARLQQKISYTDVISIPQNALLSGTSDAILNRTEEATAQGFDVFKLKVGTRNLNDEIALVSEVRDVIGSKAQLRLDANRAWDLRQAREACTALSDFNVAYIEEPVQNTKDLIALFDATDMPYALDETVQEAGWNPGLATALQDVFTNASHFIWKPSFVSTASMSKLVNTFPDSPVVLSAAFESGVGLAAVARCAGLFDNSLAAGLDTYSWLAEDVLEERLDMSSPTLDLNTLMPASQRVDINKLTLVHEVTP